MLVWCRGNTENTNTINLGGLEFALDIRRIDENDSNSPDSDSRVNQDRPLSFIVVINCYCVFKRTEPRHVSKHRKRSLSTLRDSYTP